MEKILSKLMIKILKNKKIVNQNRIIWFKGNLIKAKDAKVGILSPTAQFGLNVFEGIRGYWSEHHKELFLFRINEHLKRLFESCKIYNFSSFVVSIFFISKLIFLPFACSIHFL